MTETKITPPSRECQIKSRLAQFRWVNNGSVGNMFDLQWQFLTVIVAGALNERMQRQLDYKQQEVRLLKKVIRDLTGKGRIPLGADP